MATNNKTSALIDSLLPDYLETEGPKFQTFIKAYYEWLETTNQVTDRSKNLENYQDIDRTVDEFVKYFRREVLASFPEDILANKPLVYKKIKDLYYAKGTENAYKLLFRILYDEEIDFYYPGDDILIASDGRWVQDTTLRISKPFVGNPELFGGTDIIGLTSGATAKVERVISTTESGIPVFELFINSINGIFEDSETIQNTSGTLSGVLISSIGPLQDAVITFGGAGHQKGDVVNFVSASGTGANGTVLNTTNESITFRIVDGGSGYANGTVATISNNNSGSGATATVNAISNTEIIPIYSDKISSLANVRINQGPTFVSGGANSSSVSSNLAISNSSSVLSSAFGTTNTEVGTISSLSVTRGSNYSSPPNVTFRYDSIADLNLSDGSGGIKGDNAVIVANLLSGSISSVRVDTAGSSYNKSDLLTLVNQTRANTENAQAGALVTGINTYAGAYKDTKGFLSWNNRLQDNYYYQEYSYVVRSQQVLDAYKDLAYSITHPAGTRLFGEVRIEANIDSEMSVLFQPVIKPFDIIVPDIFIPTVVSDTANTYFESGADGGIDPEPEIEIPLDASIVDVSNYDILIGNGQELEITLPTPINTNTAELYIIELALDVTIPSALTFGDIRVSMVIEPDTILGSPLSTIAISQVQDEPITDFADDTFNTIFIADQVGIPSIEPQIDPTSITATTSLSSDAEIDMFVGDPTITSITSTTVVPGNAEVLFVGAGTMSNFLIDEISDLQNVSINNYSQLYISVGDGNKVFNGFSTTFDTQVSNGDTLYITDVNNTGEEISVTVETINDANTLSITANATFANGDIAIIDNGTFLVVN